MDPSISRTSSRGNGSGAIRSRSPRVPARSVRTRSNDRGSAAGRGAGRTTACGPYACTPPAIASGWLFTRRTNPTTEPTSKGCITPAGTSALAATTCQLPSLGCIEGLLARERPSGATRSVAAPATTPALPASAAADAATTTCLRVACGPLGGRRFPGRPVSMRPAGAGGRSGSLRLAHRWPYGRHAIR